jgi:hypothetical protein
VRLECEEENILLVTAADVVVQRDVAEERSL